MIPINIAFVVIGIIIPIGMVIFWSRARKILDNHHENISYSGTTLKKNYAYNLILWLFHYKSSLNAIMASIVTLIEFLALLPF